MLQIAPSPRTALVALGLLALSSSALANPMREAAFEKVVARFGRPTSVTSPPSGDRLLMTYDPLDFRRVLSAEITRADANVVRRWDAAHISVHATITLGPDGKCRTFSFDTHSQTSSPQDAKAPSGGDGHEALVDMLTRALPCR